MIDVSVPCAFDDAEKRVPVTPETVRKLSAAGFSFFVQKGSGTGSCLADAEFEEAGGHLCKDRATTLKKAHVVLSITAPDDPKLFQTVVKFIPEKAVWISLFNPWVHPERLDLLNSRKITALSLECLPRTSRAQAMDVLSSQANLLGYRAVIEAAALYNRPLPMMMTAAGTIPPARVLVLGAGVAGLQAIATARRLGAMVSAFDVRPAVREQVESLGAHFVDIPLGDGAEGAGGYAKTLSEEDRKRQAEALAKVLPKQDIVITTALVPGQKAPVLLDQGMMTALRPGRVVVDLAAGAGGNTALTRAGECIRTPHGVTVCGHTLMPAVAAEATALWARNMMNILMLLRSGENGGVVLPPEDDLIQGMMLTQNGKTVHPRFQNGGNT